MPSPVGYAVRTTTRPRTPGRLRSSLRSRNSLALSAEERSPKHGITARRSARPGVRKMRESEHNGMLVQDAELGGCVRRAERSCRSLGVTKPERVRVRVVTYSGTASAVHYGKRRAHMVSAPIVVSRSPTPAGSVFSTARRDANTTQSRLDNGSRNPATCDSGTTASPTSSTRRYCKLNMADARSVAQTNGRGKAHTSTTTMTTVVSVACSATAAISCLATPKTTQRVSAPPPRTWSGQSSRR